MASERSQEPASSRDESLAERLKKQFGDDLDPEVSLAGERPAAPSGAADSLLGRIAQHGPRSPRYQLEGEVARGGMGAILKIWDGDLRRHLAMKVVLGKSDATSTGGTPQVDPGVLTRFLEEAQVTGQLDHPGIVPVHELGLDADGRVYFTMKLVLGRDLKTIFDLVFAGKEGWNETRALGVILKACEAIAYAHTKGVIHRDLKPANVMVGSFGEVYVMDWGLARVLGREDAHDLRIAGDAARSVSPTDSVSTERSDVRRAAPDSPLYTMDGDVMGTPSYMPPEQARGEIDKLSARSDVYSLGAMLYHLLARQMPYERRGERQNGLDVLRAVRESGPTPLHALRKDVPPELEAICDKAMARDPGSRYGDTLDLAEDLRSFLEGRVVKAHQTGAIVELRKWVQRNKPLAAALAAAVLILVAGILVSTAKTREAEAARLETAAKNVDLVAATKLAQENEAKATAQEELATQKTNDVLSLSAIQELKELETRAAALWPAAPENVPKYEAWLSDARLLVEGQPADPARGLKRHPSLAEHEAKLAEIRRRAKSSSPEQYEFDSAEDRWWHAQLASLVADLSAFRDEKSGGLDSSGISENYGWGIARRLEFARTIAERSVSGARVKKLWDDAIDAIAKSPKYDGLKIAPQLGLVPIGADPASGLWEFSHLATAEGYEPAERGEDGTIELKDGTGIVFVLIPGGTFWMGAQSADPAAPNYDKLALNVEGPVHEVMLSPYFLSKYEMTQGQWLRFTGRNPSQYTPANYDKIWNRAGRAGTLLHPVERVSWFQCTEVMTRLGLVLPSEAQWERAARGGLDTPYWTGSDVASLAGAGNIGDAYGKTHGGESLREWEQDLDDGNTVHAEPGSYRPNPFGLHDVIGNVWEWCQDGYDEVFYRKSQGTDPVAPTDWTKSRIFRGGSFFFAASFARAANRFNSTPEFQSHDLGLRPARTLDASR
jgi:formylglycine-generating enzyme required for sulfatase activity/serine/threonine protein kinase